MKATRISLLLLASLAVPLPSSAFEPSGLLEIHYINPTIQAGVTLVIGPDGTTVLMDAGKAGDIIPDYLASIGLIAGVDDLDYTIAGHLDADHIRRFKDVFPVTGAGYDLSAVGANYFNGSDKTNTIVTAYKDAAGNTDVGEPVAVPLDTGIPLGNGATLRVIAVHGNITGGGQVNVPEENDLSVAVLIQYGDFDFVWASHLGGGDDPDCTDRDGVSSADVETPLAQAITPGGAAPLLSALGVEVLPRQPPRGRELDQLPLDEPPQPGRGPDLDRAEQPGEPRARGRGRDPAGRGRLCLSGWGVPGLGPPDR